MEDTVSLPDVVVDWYSGTLTVRGRRAVVLGVPSVVRLSNGVGPAPVDLNGLGYQVGRETGLVIGSTDSPDQLASESQAAALEEALALLRRTGWGDVRLLHANWTKRAFDFSGENLPAASVGPTGETTKRPVDGIVVGILTGVLESLLGVAMKGSEPACQAQGFPLCKIVVSQSD